MPKTREQKEKLVSTLNENLSKAKGVVFLNYKGLKVKDSEELRKSLRDKRVIFFVAKNSLLKIALREQKIEIDKEMLDMPLAIALGFLDEVSAAKEISNFAKGHEEILIQGGILEGNFISSVKVKELAGLPSRDELYAKILGLLSAPSRNLVYLLNANSSALLNVLIAKAKQ